MRLLHTADWHLGRIFHGIHLTDDQSHVLDQLVALIRDARPDALLVAGDIYDRAVPPPEAVALLDDVLARIVDDLGVPTIIIAGNHDSPDRLAFAARVLERRGLHIFGLPSARGAIVRLSDDAGPVSIVALPYVDPVWARQLALCPPRDLSAADGTSVAVEGGYTEQLAALLGQARRATCGRTVAIAHGFVAGGLVSDSERSLSVGGRTQWVWTPFWASTTRRSATCIGRSRSGRSPCTMLAR